MPTALFSLKKAIFVSNGNYVESHAQYSKSFTVGFDPTNGNSVGGEPRSTVLITHLYLEYLIDWIIRKKVKKPDAIIKWKFYSKLKLVEGFDIIPAPLMHDLWIVNEIRNLFAHRIDIESPDFNAKFGEKIVRMEYYKEAPALKDLLRSAPYNAYVMVILRIYHYLKAEFDKL